MLRPVCQVLLLWDRLLGYDNLFLLPVLAAALLIFRAQVGCTPTLSARGYTLQPPRYVAPTALLLRVCVLQALFLATDAAAIQVGGGHQPPRPRL